jgi:hypothetical protein
MINAGTLPHLELFLSYYGHIPQLQSLAMAMKMKLTTSTRHAPQVLQDPFARL